MMMNKTGKKLALILVAGTLLLSAVSYAEESIPETNLDEDFNQQSETNFHEGFGNGERKGPGPNGGHGGFGGMQGNGAGMGMMENDPEIQAVLDENAGKFEQFSFTDEETGITLEYSLYIPEGYDGEVLTVKDSEGKTLEIKADTVIMATGYRSNVDTYNELREAFPQVYNIGDSQRARNIFFAVHEANELARYI